MVYNYYCSSPVLVPPAPSTATQSLKRHVPKYPQPPSLNYLARHSHALAGRKRSRDRDDDQDEELQASSRPSSVEVMQPVLGPSTGMDMMDSDQPALNISFESQTETWLEDGLDKVSRPRLVARKSRCRVEDLPGVQNISVNEELDPIVRELGIGWKRLTDTEQSAVAGSETYIRRQYDLINPHIVLGHEGLGLFLVKSEPSSAQGYWTQWWLFKEDLNSCRFLCNDDSQLFSRLSHKRCDERGHWIPDIKCEGPEVFAKNRKGPQQSLHFKQVIYDSDVDTKSPITFQNIEDVEMSTI